MRDYKAIAYEVRDTGDRQSIIDHLSERLPDIWHREYRTTAVPPANVLTVTFGDETRRGHFVTYMFDHASDQAIDRGARDDELVDRAEDRVIAVWGLAGTASGAMRDRSRMRDFLPSGWS